MLYNILFSSDSSSTSQRLCSNIASHNMGPLSVCTHTSAQPSSSTPHGARTVLPTRKHALPPKNTNIYHYSNRHHQNNAIRNIDRKWSSNNKVYTPTVVKDIAVEQKHVKSILPSSPKNSTLSNSATHTVARKKEERRHVWRRVKSNIAASQTNLHGDVNAHLSSTHNSSKQDDQRQTQAVAPVVTSPPPQPSSSSSSSSSSSFHPLRRRVSSGSSCSKYRWRRRSTPSSKSVSSYRGN